MSAPRLLIVCDWLPPETNAVGQYMLLRARAAAADRDVTLIGLGQPPGGTEGEPPRLTIVRLPARPTPKGNKLRRLWWTIVTNFRLAGAVHRALGRAPAELVVTGSPPFLSYLLILINRIVWRRRLTYQIMDVYPEVVLAAGGGRVAAALLRLSLPLFRGLRRLADAIEALGDDQKRRLVDGGLPAERIRVTPLGSPIAIPPTIRPGPRPGVAGDALLLYSGNLGMAHEIDTFCAGYLRHVREGANRVRLWFSGGGVRAADLAAFCARHDLPLYRTAPVPLADLPAQMRAPDAHLVLLDARFWGYVHPSKIYACLEAGQPILYVGPQEADIATLIAGRPGAVRAANGDAASVFKALEQIARAAPRQEGSA